jgi:hypothetical protein
LELSGPKWINSIQVPGFRSARREQSEIADLAAPNKDVLDVEKIWASALRQSGIVA